MESCRPSPTPWIGGHSLEAIAHSNGFTYRCGCRSTGTQHVQMDWVRQGQLKWGEGWVAQHGYTRSHEPDLDDHISFVNHDLEANGFPRVERRSDQSLVMELPDSVDRDALGSILGYHGFTARGQ